jgi:hypothetical protein
LCRYKGRIAVHTFQQVEPHQFSLNANIASEGPPDKVCYWNTGRVELRSRLITPQVTDPLQSFILTCAAGMQILQSPEQARI